MAGKPKPVRWTLSKAAVEFGLDIKTITKRLQAAGSVPAEDGHYSTGQLTAALYGARERASAQARLAQAQAKKAEREEAEAARELIPIGDVIEVAGRFCSAVRQRIVNAEIPEVVKATILREIKALEDADLTEEPEREET